MRSSEPLQRGSFVEPSPRLPRTARMVTGARPPVLCRDAPERWGRAAAGEVQSRAPFPAFPTAAATPGAWQSHDKTAVGPARPPMSAEAIELRRTEHALVRAAQRRWPALPDTDAGAAVDAGWHTLAHATMTEPLARQGHDNPDAGAKGAIPDEAAAGVGEGVAAGVADAAAHAQQLPASASVPVDWAGFGQVLAVLAGSPGAGASVVSTVLADVLQLDQRRVLLADTADPRRSGLATAAGVEGPWRHQAHPHVGIRYSWRSDALLARLDTDLPVLAPGMVPLPEVWLPPQRPVQTTVADLGHDAWRLAANPITGAGAWLRNGHPGPRAVLVVRPSRPSLLQAEQVLARLEPWVHAGIATAATQLVVCGARHWPDGVAGAAGRRVSALLAHAAFLPYMPTLATAGITGELTPARARRALAPLLRRWRLIEIDRRRRGRTS